MRIAVTGTHGSGKTTLIDDFVDLHGHYDHTLEPYWDLAQQGVAFSSEPSTDEFVEQLDHSVSMILGAASEPNIIFDRCPLDFIAYLEILGENDGVEWTPTGQQQANIEAALATLDLIIFLPLSTPDDIATAIEFPTLRLEVDDRLKRIVRDDMLGLLEQGPRVVELAGARRARIAQVLRHIPVSHANTP